MQSDQIPQSGMPSGTQAAAAAERDTHTFAVADHGVDPSPMPRRRHAKPAGARNPGNDDPDRFGFKDFIVWCGIPVVVVLLLRLLVFPLYWIPSSSMMNTILKNDRVVTLSTHIVPVSKLQRGDVIVFKDPANWLGEEEGGHTGYLIKRLIGLPGDVVACAGPGEPLTVNGVAIDETAYVRPGSAPSQFAFKVTVTAGNVFVLGDNRGASADSRFHPDDGNNGLVPMANISGRAWLTFWPLNRIGLIDSHHEAFAAVPNAAAPETSDGNAA